VYQLENRELTREELIAENRNLKERLLEAEQTIEAIRGGEIDALVVERPEGEKLYTLTGADHGYRILVESITEGALILSSDDSIYYCNRTLGEMLGLPIQKIISTKLDSYVMFSEGRAQLMELINESRNCGAAKGEFLMKRSDVTLLPVNVSLNCLSFEDFEGVCAVITDLSEQKRIEEELRRNRTELELLVNQRTADLATKNAELQQEIVERKRMGEALRESQERFEILAQASFEGIGFSADGVVIDANPQLAQMLGYELSEIIGKPVADMVAPEDRELVRRYMEAGYEGCYENRLLRKDRSTLVLETQAKHFEYRGRIVRVTVMRDITERKQMDEALRKSRDELELRVRERTAELELANENLRAVPSKLIAAQENERQRLAIDLHDSIGQTLAALKFRIEHIIATLKKREHEEVLRLLNEFVPILQLYIEETSRLLKKALI
jgi:PAS domain S-box-containing protein